MSFDVKRVLKGRGLLATVAAAGVIVGGGATAFAAASDGGPGGGENAARTATPTAATPAATSTASPSAGGRVTAVEAAAAALKAAPGKVEEIELDDSVWEVGILAEDGGWREVTVHSESGKVLSDRADDEDDDRDEAAALRKAKVTASDAATAALKAASGTVTSVEFDEDDGKAVWEVEVTGRDGNERELTVHAATAKVVADDGGDRDDDRDDG